MDRADSTPEVVPPPAQPPPVQADTLSLVHHIFFNDVELRAGWRLLIFYSVLTALTFGITFTIRFLLRLGPQQNLRLDFSPGLFIAFDGANLVLLLAAAAVMARLESRKLRYYGLPLQAALRGNFWLGCVWGFAAISALLLVLRVNHNFYFGAPELRGWHAAQYAFLWGVAFLMVALSEEFMVRGYPQFTLTTGLGFWPSAVLLSLLFAFIHRDNPGETMFGLFQIVLIALFFCLTLWRTGTLWFAVGFHTAWDWAQSFFYGTPDSGLVAKGHLLHSSFYGSKWLTGGTVGPEGSVLTAPLLLLVGVLFYLAHPKREPYPDPAAIKLADPGLASSQTLA